MNDLARFAPDLAGAWLIFSAVAIATVAALGAEVLARGFFKINPAARHDITLVGLLLVLASPAIAAAVQWSGLALRALPAERARGATIVAPIPIRSDPPALIVPEPSAASQQPRDATPDEVATVVSRFERAEIVQPQPSVVNPLRVVAGGLVVAWGTGVALLTSHLVGGITAVRLIRRRAKSVPTEILGEDLRNEVRAALGLGVLPPILTASRVVGPVAMGWLSPMVILPERFHETWSTGMIRDVLIHECAHVLRGDSWIVLLERVAAVIFWPHPLVHRLNAQLLRAREEVCDDHVLRLGDPGGYARTLLTLVEKIAPEKLRRTTTVGLLGTRWRFEDRISRILDERTVPMTRGKLWIRLLSGGILLALGLGVAAIRPALGRADNPPVDPSAVSFVVGRVVDEAGKPVAGVRVNATWFRKAARDATTDADGRFSLALGSPIRRSETVRASGNGGERLGTAEYREPMLAPEPPLVIVLKPARSLVAHVVDEAGKPVADALVEVRSPGNGPLDQATTGPNGAARFRLPPDAAVDTILACKDGVGFDYFENYRTWPSHDQVPPPPEATLVLDGARTVTAKAVDGGGQPVSGVKFRLQILQKSGKLAYANLSGSEITTATTDAEGVARFGWLPKRLEQRISLSPSTWDFSAEQTAIGVSGDESRTVRVWRSTHASGRVTARDGAAVPGIVVELAGFGKTGSKCYFARTDAEGRYSTLVAPEKTYLVATIDRDRAAAPLTGVVVREGQDRKNLDLQLVEPSRIQGQVVDSQGKPAVGACFTYKFDGAKIPEEFHSSANEGGFEHVFIFAPVNSEGRYQVAVPRGTYQCWEQSQTTPEHQTVVIDNPGEVLIRDYLRANAEPTFPLAGQVVDPDGQPVPDALVRITGSKPLPRQLGLMHAVADANGRLSVKNPFFKGTIYARDQAGSLAGSVKFPSGKAEVRISLEAAASVSGRVVDDKGRPIAGRSVHLRMGKRSLRGEDLSQDWTTTDALGKYAFAGVIPGWACDVTASESDEFDGPNLAQVEKFVAPRSGPIMVPDLVFPVRPIP